MDQPHHISNLMRGHVPASGRFNHQNAWSREELRVLLAKHDFIVTSMSPEDAYGFPIPDIKDQAGISMYAVAG
jgi:hypothetical protein